MYVKRKADIAMLESIDKEIVFSMIEIGQMRKTRRDKREDFNDVYEFHDAFSRDLAFVVPDSV
jgi:uncharacterized repeat protein (TIGR04138 family)